MPGALHPDFQSEAGDPMWTCCLWPETISEPTAPRKQLLSWDAQPESSYTASSTAKVGTLTSLLHSHRQPLHQKEAVSPCSPHFYFMLVKNTGLIVLGCIYPHAGAMRPLLHLAWPAHLHQDVLGAVQGLEGQFSFHRSLPRWPLHQKGEEKPAK